MLQVERRTVHLTRDGGNRLAQFVHTGHEVWTTHYVVRWQLGDCTRTDKERSFSRLVLAELPLEFVPAQRKRPDERLVLE